MIVLEAVNTTGLFSFGLMPTIPLENIGCVFLQGINEDHGNGSNGAGKSSILNAIKEIAYEMNDTKKSGPNVVNKHTEWTRGAFGILWLRDKMNRRWRIAYLRKWKGAPPDNSMSEPSDVLANGNKYQGSDLFLERWDGQKWVDERPTSMTNKTTKSTRDKIRDEVLGMTYDQFSAYVCLGQQAESALVTGTGGEREKVIQAIADVSVWDSAVAIVKDLITTKEAQLVQINAKVSGLESAVGSITIPTAEAIKDAEDVYAFIRTECNSLEQEMYAALAVEKGIETELQESEKEIGGLEQELDILVAEERHSNERFHKIAPVNRAGIQLLINECAVLQDKIDGNNALLKQYKETQVGRCSTCGQEVTQEHLRREIDRLAYLNTPLIQELQDKTNRYRQMSAECDSAEEKFRSDSKIIYDREIAGIQAARAKLMERMHKPLSIKTRLETARSASILAQSKLRAKEQEGMAAASDVKGLQMRVMECQNLIAARDSAKSELTSLNSEIQHLKWVERNLKKIKLTEYESAIERLNILIDEELTKVWGPGLGVRFVTAQDKARGGVKQELDLIAYTPNKSDVPVEMYSGGQKKVIVIAAFRAMRRLANERGIGVNLAAIDEIDKDLDDSNTDRLVEAFESIAHDSPSCIVISHNTRLLNTMRFDDTWTVRMVNEMSTIEFGAQAKEKVA